jgi:hypothetical protein
LWKNKGRKGEMEAEFSGGADQFCTSKSDILFGVKHLV